MAETSTLTPTTPFGTKTHTQAARHPREAADVWPFQAEVLNFRRSSSQVVSQVSMEVPSSSIPRLIFMWTG
jgi:hypothetical protein